MPVPVHVERRDDLYRLIEPSGNVAESDSGTAVDHGGFETEDDANKRANTVNESRGVTTKKSDSRTLYVYRQIRNPMDIISWAKSHGFEKTLPPDDLHVTIAFSRDKLDWGYLEPCRKRITNHLIPGRVVKPLGDKGAVVLGFKSPLLAKRWRYFRNAGASWDYPGYQPHVTITYNNPPDMDPNEIPPYEGPIILGAEIFAEIVEDWDKTVTEKARRGARPRYVIHNLYGVKSPVDVSTVKES